MFSSGVGYLYQAAGEPAAAGGGGGNRGGSGTRGGRAGKRITAVVAEGIAATD